jgi:hypothetical protein
MKHFPYAVDRIGPRRPGPVLSRAVRIEQPMAGRSAVRGSHRADSSSDFRYYVDSEGRQRFNFAQQIWLRASVDMAVTPVLTLALETLAVNLLTHLTRPRDCRVAVGVTSRRVLKLAPLFCIECLLTAQAEGWLMPRATIKEWISSHARAGRRQTR